MTAPGLAEARRKTAEAYKALRAHVDPDAFRAAFQGDRNLRDLVVGSALMYAHPEKVLTEYQQTGAVADLVRVRAATVLAHWNADRKAAEAEGRSEAFVAGTWDVGLDAAVCALSAADLRKMGALARTCF